jgi:PadR family transcriptional regulator PadR
MSDSPVGLPQGTFDLLVLKILALGPHRGWAIAQRIQQISRDAVRVQQGTLYPALHRLERRGIIKARWSTTEGKRVKFYELTREGKKQLEAEESNWHRLTTAVAQILETA